MMVTHIVQNGDTVESIANQYNISSLRLLTDNNLSPHESLVIGQALMIAPPEQRYTVNDGDTIESIAESNGISVLQLLRNNPYLLDKSTVSTGEELTISYPRDKSISVMGYATAYISERVLRKSLLYLTYLIILNYRVDALGNIADVDDANILQMALEYGVEPIMFVSSMTQTGRGSYATTHAIISNMDVQIQVIQNILRIMKTKGFAGVNFAFYSITEEDLTLYVDFIRRATQRLNREGFEVFVTLTPQTMGYQVGTPYDKTFYADLGEAANKVIIISYLWQQSSIDQYMQTTYGYLKESLDFIVTQIPPEKIYVGLTRIAYDWELPYIEGETLGASLTNAGAVELARQLGSDIEYDEETQAPYFYYNSLGIDHFVWFKDARSINAILRLVDEYNLAGVAVWNITYYRYQVWLTINSQYDINVSTDTENI